MEHRVVFSFNDSARCINGPPLPVTRVSRLAANYICRRIGKEGVGRALWGRGNWVLFSSFFLGGEEGAGWVWGGVGVGFFV